MDITNKIPAINRITNRYNEDCINAVNNYFLACRNNKKSTMWAVRMYTSLNLFMWHLDAFEKDQDPNIEFAEKFNKSAELISSAGSKNFFNDVFVSNHNNDDDFETQVSGLFSDIWVDMSDDIYFDINGRELQRSRVDDKKDRGDKDSKGDDKKSKKKNCFYLEYPLSIEFADDTVVEVADRKEHCNVLKTWHKANPNVKERAQFVFPIGVYWVEKDSKTMYTISNQDEMRELHGKCKDSKESDRKN